MTLGTGIYATFFAENWSTFYNLSLHMVLLGTPCIVAAILWYKTPDLNDSFGIIQESRIAMRIGFVLLILYPIISITPLMGVTEFTRRILGNILNSSLYITSGLYYTLYAIKLAKKYGNNGSGSMFPSTPPSYSNQLTLKNVRHHQALNSSSTSSNNNTPKSVDNLMQRVLSQDVSFNEFMSHLSNEFSMELLLSFVEFVQFKSAIRETQQFKLDDDSVISEAQKTVLQNGFIPSSFVVHGNYDKVVQDFHDNYHTKINVEILNNNEHDKILKEYQIRGCILYHKYVNSSSAMQINLSDGEFKILHHKIINHGDDLNEEDLFNLYDAALNELWKLLRHSFYRFMKSDKYRKLDVENDFE